MSALQESALYGELVRHLRDQCVVKITALDPAQDPAAARAWADAVIRDWLLTPHEDMHGSTPAEIIWRERKGEPNVLPKGHAHEMVFDDCPVCQAMKEMELEGEWHWGYDDGGFGLVDEYDRAGADAYWKEEDERFEKWKAENPRAIDERMGDPQHFIDVMKELNDDSEYRDLFESDPNSDEENMT